MFQKSVKFSFCFFLTILSHQRISGGKKRAFSEERKKSFFEEENIQEENVNRKKDKDKISLANHLLENIDAIMQKEKIKIRKELEEELAEERDLLEQGEERLRKMIHLLKEDFEKEKNLIAQKAEKDVEREKNKLKQEWAIKAERDQKLEINRLIKEAEEKLDRERNKLKKEMEDKLEEKEDEKKELITKFEKAYENCENEKNKCMKKMEAMEKRLEMEGEKRERLEKEKNELIIKLEEAYKNFENEKNECMGKIDTMEKRLEMEGEKKEKLEKEKNELIIKLEEAYKNFENEKNECMRKIDTMEKRLEMEGEKKERLEKEKNELIKKIEEMKKFSEEKDKMIENQEKIKIRFEMEREERLEKEKNELILKLQEIEKNLEMGRERREKLEEEKNRKGVFQQSITDVPKPLQKSIDVPKPLQKSIAKVQKPLQQFVAEVKKPQLSIFKGFKPHESMPHSIPLDGVNGLYSAYRGKVINIKNKMIHEGSYVGSFASFIEQYFYNCFYFNSDLTMFYGLVKVFNDEGIFIAHEEVKEGLPLDGVHSIFCFENGMLIDILGERMLGPIYHSFPSTSFKQLPFEFSLYTLEKCFYLDADLTIHYGGTEISKKDEEIKTTFIPHPGIPKGLLLNGTHGIYCHYFDINDIQYRNFIIDILGKKILTYDYVYGSLIKITKTFKELFNEQESKTLDFRGCFYLSRGESGEIIMHYGSVTLDKDSLDLDFHKN